MGWDGGGDGMGWNGMGMGIGIGWGWDGPKENLIVFLSCVLHE